MAPAGEGIEHAVVGSLAARGLRLATAESFTGGLLARLITSVPGASRVFPVGWVTYAPEQKTLQLGVPAELIEADGVVSDRVAAAMAEGALARGGVQAALATTGCAGPDRLEQPGHAPVPVGRVFIALAMAGRQTQVRGFDFPPPREHIQHMGAHAALAMLMDAL